LGHLFFRFQKQEKPDEYGDKDKRYYDSNFFFMLLPARLYSFFGPILINQSQLDKTRQNHEGIIIDKRDLMNKDGTEKIADTRDQKQYIGES